MTKKNVLHEDIFMEGTEQNAATLGVSVVVLEPLLGPLQPWVCNMPILDLDDVGVNKKPFCMGIFIWEGQIPSLRGRQSKMQQPWGYLWSF